MNHLLVSCVFSRQVWYNILKAVDLEKLSPQHGSSCFDEWWEGANRAITVPVQKASVPLSFWEPGHLEPP
jgi:hypothetical protein